MLNKSVWKAFYGKIRRHGRGGDYCPRGDNSTIGQRVKLHQAIRKYARNGELSFNVDSMDCDCYRVQSSRNVPAFPPVSIEARINYEYDGAEGPTSVWIDTPIEQETRESRDLALEAFEDGHPHVIYY